MQRRKHSPEPVVAGVCVALSRSLALPVGMIRLAFVLLFCLFGVGLIPYAIIAIVLHLRNSGV